MLTATHSLTAEVSGSGTVLYGEAAHVTRRVTGSGAVSAD
jgi:2-polyprenyl-6-methoxyphenol hydroxylase-like FAD-dependent oxidoreductase